MKTTIKSIFTLSILILVIFFASCEVDKEIIEKNPSNGIIARRYSLQSQEGKANYKLNKVVNQIKDIQSNTQINSRVVFNPIAGILFDDEKGLYIQLDEKQSYTFPVINLNPNAKVENICFNEKTDGNFDIYLVKYDFTKEEHETLTREELEQRQTVVEALSIDGFEVSIESVTCIQILQFIPSTAVAPLDEGELTGNFGTQNGSGTWITLANYCFEENDGVGGDNGFNNGFGTGGTDTGSDNGGGNGTSDGGVITGSVIDNTETTLGNTPVGVMIDLFKSTLEPNQLSIFNSHPEFANYLALNNCSPNSMNAVNYLVNYIIQNEESDESNDLATHIINTANDHGGYVNFDENINSSNALVFDSVEEFDDFFDSQQLEASDFEYEIQQNEITASTKFWVAGFFGGVKVNIKQNLTPIYSVSDVNSNAFGLTAGFSWTQSSYDVSIVGDIVTINIFGVINYNLFVEGVGTVFTSNMHFQIKINKSNGNIISATRIN